MNAVIFGSQWGDEGKGKIISNLASSFDFVVRFQGGNNAGHTVIKEGKSNKFSALPCGILDEGVRCVLGSGVVLDLPTFVREIEDLESKGLSVQDKLLLSDNLSIILPIHRALDAASESMRNDRKIGTTAKGIGPCYEDRVGRRAVRICDIANNKVIDDLMKDLENRYLPIIGDEFYSLKAAAQQEFENYYSKIAKYMVPSKHIAWLCSDKNNKVLFEGSQGYWLDVYHGTYPYVTSSSTLPAQACSGTPTTPASLGMIVGVAKAYVTRVGNGPMPTEQDNEIGDTMVNRGFEFGTVTKRRRRCGWFDAVMVKQALFLSGAHALVLTKLDVLDGFDYLKICYGYKLRGVILDYVPSSAADQAELEPLYEEHNGWKEKTEGLTDSSLLPREAANYIKRIEELVGVPVAMVSTNPKSEDIMVYNKPLYDSILAA